MREHCCREKGGGQMSSANEQAERLTLLVMLDEGGVGGRNERLAAKEQAGESVLQEQY